MFCFLKKYCISLYSSSPPPEALHVFFHLSARPPTPPLFVVLAILPHFPIPAQDLSPLGLLPGTFVLPRFSCQPCTHSPTPSACKNCLPLPCTGVPLPCHALSLQSTLSRRRYIASSQTPSQPSHPQENSPLVKAGNISQSSPLFLQDPFPPSTPPCTSKRGYSFSGTPYSLDLLKITKTRSKNTTTPLPLAAPLS